MHIGDDAGGQELREIGFHQDAADLRAVLPVQCLCLFDFKQIDFVMLDGWKFVKNECVVFGMWENV